MSGGKKKRRIELLEEAVAFLLDVQKKRLPSHFLTYLEDLQVRALSRKIDCEVSAEPLGADVLPTPQAEEARAGQEEGCTCLVGAFSGRGSPAQSLIAHLSCPIHGTRAAVLSRIFRDKGEADQEVLDLLEENLKKEKEQPPEVERHLGHGTMFATKPVREPEKAKDVESNLGAVAPDDMFYQRCYACNSGDYPSSSFVESVDEPDEDGPSPTQVNFQQCKICNNRRFLVVGLRERQVEHFKARAEAAGRAVVDVWYKSHKDQAPPTYISELCSFLSTLGVWFSWTTGEWRVTGKAK